MRRLRWSPVARLHNASQTNMSVNIEQVGPSEAWSMRQGEDASAPVIYTIRESHGGADIFRSNTPHAESTITMTHARAVSVVAHGRNVFVATGSLVVGQDQRKVGFKDTPMLPGGKWHVHDGDRPMPPVVTPGTSSTQEEPGRPPSDAVVLFDGKDLSHWRGRSGKPAAWKVVEGALVIAPGAGEILSRDEFGDCQLHLEFAAPVPRAAATRDGVTAA